MAERIAKKIAKNRKIGDVKFSSAGIKATGENITENAKLALKSLGYDGRNRKSVRLKKIKPNCLYVAVTNDHKKFINSKKVISFEDLAGKVIDPYGQDLETYIKSARLIEKNILLLFDKIGNLRGEL